VQLDWSAAGEEQLAQIFAKTEKNQKHFSVQWLL
jgi:hypothetical protein